MKSLPINKYPDHWENLEDCPDFLSRIPDFGMVSFFDQDYNCLSNSWTEVYHTSNKIILTNHAEISKSELELNSILHWILTQVKEEGIIWNQFPKKLEFQFSDLQSKNKLLLSLTKPNALECKYKLYQTISFDNYWKMSEYGKKENPFSLIFQISTVGFEILVPEDIYLWREYGALEPIDPKSIHWLVERMKELGVLYSFSNPCRMTIPTIKEFLWLYDIFWDRSIK